MQEYRAIAYLSRANREFTQACLNKLLNDARQFNQTHDVTGVLLHNPGLFFQYIEGSNEAIEETYLRIQDSTSHFILMKVCDQPEHTRYFSNWSMGFCRAPEGFIQELTHQNWVVNKDKLEQIPTRPTGLEMLLKFWKSLASHP